MGTLNPMAVLSSTNGARAEEIISKVLNKYNIKFDREVTWLNSLIGGKHRHDFVIKFDSEKVVVESKSQMSSGGDMWQKVFYTIDSLSANENTKSVIVFSTGDDTKTSVINNVIPALERHSAKTKNVRFITLGKFIDVINQNRLLALFA